VAIHRPRLATVVHVLGGIREASIDFIRITRDMILAFNALHRKSQSINVGDMVVIRMGDTRHGTDSFVGRSGMVVYKNANPVWSKYSILIDTHRISFMVGDIEKC